MESKNKDWFKYDKYWRQWSRVICRGGGDFNYEIEIILTPLNGTTAEWSDLAKIQIHRHDVRYSAFKNDNHYTHVLPENVYEQMVRNISRNKLDILLHSDILPLIDWEEYDRLGDSYVPFSKCAIKQTGFFNQLYWGDGTNRETFPTAEQFAKEYGIDIPEDHILLGGVYHQHNDSHVQCYGVHDLTNNTIQFEALLDGESYSIITRFSSRIGNTEKSWDIPLIEFFQKSPYVNIETFDAILQMVTKTINNLKVYKKG
ncbi:hypothetical protein YUBABA_00950 [Serratia phage vB_SmaM-Yubaba]|nr:hypothetical protein SUREIYA_01410 [Serratia phage vB_SmaM-Sureiya]UQT03301.1 hypothetical protein YUBABA_00950 [Serratia phage vB_SmaM-Yubaba]